MMPLEWQWPVTPSALKHDERVGLMRQIPYELTRPLEEEEEGPERRVDQNGQALSINISSGGMLLLMKGEPAVEQVMTIHVPTPINSAEVPTLAEVRWVRKVPFTVQNSLYFVGLRFILA